MISVIIPTLNAASELSQTLVCLQRAHSGLIKEIIIADAGSVDDTCDVARVKGVTFVDCPVKGRGNQLKEGAERATQDWLLFLHADTILINDWESEIRDFIARDDCRAATFTYRLDAEGFQPRMLEKIVEWRSKLLALPYGDQGLLISKKLYNEIGGFQDIPIMEDVAIIRKIGRRRLYILKSAALTSADRYKKDGYILRMCRNMTCLALWFLGVSEDHIKKLYS